MARLLGLVGVGLLVASPALAQNYYQMPAPSFGYTEVQGITNCWVEQDHVGASDSTSYGTFSNPRLTLPTAPVAGTICQITGSYDLRASFTVTSSGTVGSPVWYFGATGATINGNGIGHIANLAGTYLTFSNIHFNGTRVDLEGAYVSLRNSDVGDTTSVGCVAAFGTLQVITGNTIHDCGDSESPTEQDFHCVYVARGSLGNWVLANTIHSCGGDGIQVGDTIHTAGVAENVFIGGNTIYSNRENAVDVKDSEDVIISTNVMYGYSAKDSSNGEAVVVHDEPVGVWVINNFIYASKNGIVCSAATGIFILGNIVSGTINAIPDTSPYDDVAILAYNSYGVYVLYNTARLWDNGISTPSGNTGENIILGNIIGAVYPINIAGMTVTRSNNLVNTDPSFVNEALLNYRLQPTSVAIGTGTAKTAIHTLYETTYSVTLTLDIYGIRRPAIYAIGASEAHGLAAPTGLRLSGE